MRYEIRLGEEADFDSIQHIDEQVVGKIPQRSEIIAKAIVDKRCKVILMNSQLLGYSIWNQGSFREMDLLSLLVVNPLCRRRGLASALITDFQNASKGVECWTSTNASNIGMRSLLEKLGWLDSGYAEEMDSGDPDLYYFWRKDDL